MKILVILRIVAGFIALIFGAVGLFLPVWPTTPFVLLAVGCFSATPRLQGWMMRIRVFRQYYESYHEGKGLPRKTVVFSLVFLWGMLAISGVMIQKPVMYLVFGVIGAVVTAHILWIARTRKKKRLSVLGDEENG